MREHLLPALRTTAVTLVLTGLLYPVAVTGAAQLLFRERANGSLVRDERGNVVGSELIAQGFARAATDGDSSTDRDSTVRGDGQQDDAGTAGDDDAGEGRD